MTNRPICIERTKSSRYVLSLAFSIFIQLPLCGWPCSALVSFDGSSSFSLCLTFLVQKFSLNAFSGRDCQTAHCLENARARTKSNVQLNFVKKNKHYVSFNEQTYSIYRPSVSFIDTQSAVLVLLPFKCEPPPDGDPLHERNGRSDAIGARFRFPELLITYDRLPWLPVLFDFDWSDWFVLC